MPVGANPLNIADFDLEYSTNQGGAYTAFGADDVVDVIPDKWARKVIKRLLHNQDAELVHLGKINYGNILTRLEHHSAIFNIVQGWIATRNTEIWLRHSAEDTGGTNDSSIVYKGFCHEVKPPESHGDDETAMLEFALALYAIVWTAAV